MSQSAFETAFNRLLYVEGDYSDNLNDRGGKTRWGITEAVARDYGYTDDMRDLPLPVAMEIAKKKYWDVLCLDDILPMVGPDLTYELFEIGYNMGVGWSGLFLQRALNAFNRTGLDYPDIKVDGRIGPRTLMVLSNFVLVRGRPGLVVLHRAVECQQGERYLDLTDLRPGNEDFVFGWFRLRIGV